MLPVLIANWEERGFCLYAKDVQETFLCPKLTPTPVESRVIEGYFFYDGDWIPVVAGSTLLGCESRELGLFDVLILSAGPKRWALRVQGLEGVVRTDWKAIQPSTTFGEKLPGLVGDFTHNNRVLPVFVLPQVLLGLEREVMEFCHELVKVREEEASRALKERA